MGKIVYHIFYVLYHITPKNWSELEHM